MDPRNSSQRYPSRKRQQTGRHSQKPLSASEAWELLEDVLRRPIQLWKRRHIMASTHLMRNNLKLGTKPYKFQQLLLDVQRQCGPLSVVLCIIGLGQARIASMNQKSRSGLLSILTAKTNHPLLGKLKELVPPPLAETPSISYAKPEIGIYYKFTLATVDRAIQTTCLTSHLLQYIDKSPVRIWETNANSRLVIGTETIRMNVPNTQGEDCRIILDVGLAQNIMLELFPQPQRIILPSCCPDHYTCTGVSVEALSVCCGLYIAQAVAESQLRKWEVQNGQEETTECVSLELREPSSRYGILKLRIGWDKGFEMANMLYAEP